MQEPRFHFIVPLRSSVTAAGRWSRREHPDGRSVEACVNRCLASLFNQTAPVVIHLVAHEMPDIDVPENCVVRDADADAYTSAIETLNRTWDNVRHVLMRHAVAFARPNAITREEYERLSGKPIAALPVLARRYVGDKYSKAKCGLRVALHDPSGRFAMFVDADDLVHRDVAAYALDRVGRFRGGHTVTQGYGWAVGDDYFRPMTGFHGTCGTCNAVYLDDSDKDTWLRTFDLHKFDRRKHWLYAGHSSVFRRLRNVGRNTEKFPFRAAVYVTDTGNNISGTRKAGRGIVALTGALREEFGLYTQENHQ